MNELISVIITNYNYGRYIEKAIDSIYQQTYQSIELIIINDGSTDDSVARISAKLKKAPAHLQVKFIDRENRGIVRTRNEGIALASGTYYLFLDADDYFDADFVEKMLQVAKASAADVVYPNWHVFDETGQTNYKTNYPEFDITKYQLQQLHVSSESLVKKATTQSFTFRSEKVAEDWDFFNRLALAGKSFKLAQDCTINYLVKEDGRGERNSQLDDILEFEKIMDSWRAEYGADRVIAPNRLLKEKFNNLEQHAKNLEKIASERNDIIAQQSRELNDKNFQLSQKSLELQTILSSRSYKLGKVFFKYPIALLRQPRLIGQALRKVRAKFHPIRSVKKKVLSQIRTQQRGRNHYQNPKRALVYVIYENQPRLQSYKIIFLAALAKLSAKVLIVVNGDLPEADLAKLGTYGQVVTRENKGYDTAAFKYGVQQLAPELSNYDELLLVNDTNVGPLTDLQEVFDKMAAQRLDFWGISYGEPQVDFTGYNKYGRIPEHLQSYFLVIEKNMLQSRSFLNYWAKLGDTDSRNKAIGRHETVFTKHFADLGFKHGAVSGNNQDSAMYIHPLTMIQDFGVPLVKYTAFANDSNDKFAWQGLQRETEVPALLTYIKEQTTYPPAVLEQILFDIKHSVHKSHILIIDGVANAIPQCTRYRVENKAEQLRSLGYEVWTINAADFQMGYAEYASCIIIYRTAYSAQLAELCRLARKYHKPVFYDIDDLVIDNKYTDLLAYTQNLSEPEKAAYDAGVRSYGEMLALCDAAITTTAALQKELTNYKPKVLLNRNLASQALLDLSKQAAKAYPVTSDKVKLGYFSGSITHNENFALIQPAILQLLKKYPKVELHLVGHLTIPAELAAYKAQLVSHDYVDWQKLPQLISQVDINLAPLVDNIFNQAKSEIKWLEAALVKVPTVASNLGSFAEMVVDHETGLLANENQWFDKLEELILNPTLRQEIAERAHETVLEHGLAVQHQDELTREIDEISKKYQN